MKIKSLFGGTKMDETVKYILITLGVVWLSAEVTIGYL